jgi:DNA polymerase-3 subunit epsilon
VRRDAYEQEYERTSSIIRSRFDGDVRRVFKRLREELPARVAGLVVLRAISETGLTLNDWLPRVEHSSFPVSGNAPNPDGPLVGNVIVFTGTLSLVRGQAAAMAAAAGCDVRNTVTHDTTLLVVGDQDIRRLLGHEKSGKHRKAETLILASQQLRIITERDFIGLLAVESASGPVAAAS